MTGRHLILCLLLVVALSAQGSAATTLPVIVQLAPTANLGGILSIVDGTLVDSIPDANIFLINIDPTKFSLLQNPLLGIQWAETNTGISLPHPGQLGILNLAPGATADWYKDQPSMLLIRSQQAQAQSKGKGVVVADINSQFDYSHPALRGHLTSGYDFVSSKPTNQIALNQSSADFLDQSSADFLDQSGASFLAGTPLLGMNPAYSHGTLCAGLIAVVAPEAMIMPLRAFDEQGGSDTFMLTKAIRYAVSHGAHVINMSFGTLTDSKALRNAIDYASQRNVVLIASAGNKNTSSPQYPAAYPGVTAVSSTDLQDVKGSFSNYGSYVAVDAPGVNVISAYPDGLYSVVSGTSFSAPIVAGTAALVRSMRSTGISSSISSTTVNIDSKNPDYAGKLGTGRVDVLRAVRP